MRQFADLFLILPLLCSKFLAYGSSHSDVAQRSLSASRRALAGSNTTTPIINVDEEPASVLDATAWALIYTYPLAIFSSWAGGVLRNVPVNTIYHQRNLASPDDPGVIKPNVDTLYSRVVLDLSADDVVLTVPNITDGRYWVYPVYDPFGNNQAEIGAVNGNAPGDYLIRRADDVFAAPGYSNDTRTYNSSAYRGVINLPGSYGTMLIRLLLLQNTTQDLDAVHRIQNASKLTNLPRASPGQEQVTVQQQNTNPAPSLQSLALQGNLLGIQGPAAQLEFAARIVPHSQPQVVSERYRVAGILARAGIYGGHFHRIQTLNYTAAAVLANSSISADVQNPAHIRDQGNEWSLSIPSYQGNFGTHYASAAYVALAGYQQQTVRQTLYPGYRSLGFTSQFALEPNRSLLLTFSGKPKLAKYGFWSLSVYGADQYLVPNPLNRFEVGDRTYNLTYDNGQRIYGPDANASQDGPFRILIQPASLPPPANWTNNWLPSSTTFSWILRWYVPQPAQTNGSYVYPKVENITAIV